MATLTNFFKFLKNYLKVSGQTVHGSRVSCYTSYIKRSRSDGVQGFHEAILKKSFFWAILDAHAGNKAQDCQAI